MHVARNATARVAVPPLGLATLVALGLCSPPAARAQTVLSGHHDGSNGDGADVRDGAFAVLPDTGGVPSATFNNNQNFGLTTFNASLAIAGGQFNGNGADGLYVFTGTAAVSGGQFNGNGDYGVIFTNTATGTVGGTISGGTFAGDLVGLDTENSASVTVTGGTFTSDSLAAVTSYTGSDITVTGGQFSGNGYDFYASNGNTTQFPAGAIDIYGSFLLPGSNRTRAPGQTFSLTGSGSFTGTLADNTVAQVYTYDNYSAAITLHEVALAAAPEPSQAAAIALGARGLAVLTLRARKRSA